MKGLFNTFICLIHVPLTAHTLLLLFWDREIKKSCVNSQKTCSCSGESVIKSKSTSQNNTAGGTYCDVMLQLEKKRNCHIFHRYTLWKHIHHRSEFVFTGKKFYLELLRSRLLIVRKTGKYLQIPFSYSSSPLFLFWPS